MAAGHETAAACEGGTTGGKLLQRARGLLACPEHGVLDIDGSALACPTCALRLTIERGVLRTGNLETRLGSPAGRLMHSSMIASLYEGAWRPAAIRLVSRLDYELEDATVDRYVDGRGSLRVLELCCGTARAARRLVERGAVAVGIDVSDAMLCEARRRCWDEKLVLLKADATQRFTRIGAFDVAICFAALHLLQSARDALLVAAQCLRPGGIFIGWSVGSNDMRPIMSSLLRHVGINPMAQGELDAMAAAAGLQPVASSSIGGIDLLVARRLGS